MANRHTVILMQPSPNKATRTFKDYDSITQAMHGSVLLTCGVYIAVANIKKRASALLSFMRKLGN